LAALNEKAEGAAVTRVELMKLEALERFVRDAQNVGDVSSIGSRIGLITKREGLREKLFETEFGESQMKQPFQLLFNESSLVRRDFEDARKGITADVSVYEEQAEAARRGTAQLRLADVSSRIDGVIKQFEIDASDDAIRAETQRTLDSALEKTRRSGTGGVQDYIAELAIDAQEKFFGRGATAADEVQKGIASLEARMRDIVLEGTLRGRRTEAEREQIALLKSVRDELLTLRDIAANTKKNPYKESVRAARQASESYGGN
jgi:hypothetical protein